MEKGAENPEPCRERRTGSLRLSGVWNAYDKEKGEYHTMKKIESGSLAVMLDEETLGLRIEKDGVVWNTDPKKTPELIFAEGTRSKNGNHPLEFKGGSFKAATKARCPIVPVALIDTYKAFDTGSIEPLTVQVHFLKPMYYDEYKDMKTTEIASEVKRRVEETIKEYGGWD